MASKVIFIDTREQLPIQFKGSVRMKLDVGDYTSQRSHNKLHLERKSPADLYGTLLKGHPRFRRELKRAAASGVTLIMLIECTRKQFYAKEWPGGQYCKVSDITLRRIINTLTIKYNLRFIWCKDREVMRETILKLLK